MTGVYPALFDDGPLAGQLVDLMRDERGKASAMVVTHHAPKLDLDPEAGKTVPARAVYYLNDKRTLQGGAHDGLTVFVYREGSNELPEDEAHGAEPTA